MKITKETINRALRTFLQSALAYLTVNGIYINLTGDKAGDRSILIGFFISVFSAGIAGLMNLERGEENDI